MSTSPTEQPTPNEIGRRQVRLSVGGANRGQVDNQTIQWAQLLKRLSHVTVTPEKFLDYQRSSPDVRNDLKNTPGYWIGAHCEGGRRKKAGITERDVMCFDIDNGSLYDGDLVKMLRERNTPLSEFEFFVHSSRSHTAVSPRLRLVFLLNKPVSADKYEAFSRILAHRLDPEMKTVDPVSFRLAQMMYMPSCSVDMPDQFVAFRNAGKLVEPDAVLASWPHDWSDHSKLPRCHGEEDLRQSAAKAEDPTEKKGLIGSFCRTYDIYSAIQTFLPDTFIETDYEGSEVRYKYHNSEGGAGAVVYENGLFLYSHHGTDPHSDRLLNVWDLVRLHKFSDLDEKTRGDVPITSMPSHKAMMELAANDQNTKAQRAFDKFGSLGLEDIDTGQQVDVAKDIIRAEYVEDDIMSDLLGAENTPSNLLTERSDNAPGAMFTAMTEDDVKALVGASARATRGWTSLLDMSEKGLVKPTSYNLALIMANDSRLKGAFALNRLTGQYVQLKDLVGKDIEPLLMDPKNTRDTQLTDKHISWIRMLLDSPSPSSHGAGYDLRMAFNEIDAVLKVVADTYAFHPVLDWIGEAPWDGVPRIDTFLIRHLKVDDTPYNRAVSRLMFLGASARVMEPGHKFDTAVILEGIQGAGKSTFISALANHKWFGELDADLSDRRKAVEQMTGQWFVELPELAAFTKREVDEIKSFISQQRAQVRAAYARNADIFERQCTFVGSTNRDTYLMDTTGNRRFLPVRVPTNLVIDNIAVKAEAQQAHAEAMHIFKQMRRETPKTVKEDLPLHLPPHLWADAAEETSRRVMDDYEQIMAEKVVRWANRPVPLSTVVQELNLSPQWEIKGDPMVIRNFIQADAIWVGALGRAAKDFDNKATFLIGRIIAATSDWARSEGRRIDGPRRRGFFRITRGGLSAEFDGIPECVYTLVGDSPPSVGDDTLGGLL